MSLLEKGGILMIPIVICSIVSLAIIVERLVQLARVRRENMRFLDAIRGRIRKGNLEKAVRILTTQFELSLTTCGSQSEPGRAGARAP